MKRAREIEATVKSICLEEEAKTNIYEDNDIYENIPSDQLMNCDNCVIIYSNGNTEHETKHNDDIITGHGNKPNLNGEQDNIIRLYNCVPMTGLTKKDLVSFVFSLHTKAMIFI